MRNSGIILLSAGVLLIGFSLLTPLLFFLIEAALNKSSDASVLLQMEHALLSCIGLALLILGSIFSKKISLPIIISSSVALLALAVSGREGLLGLIITGCYYLSLLTSFGFAIAILHTSHPSYK